LQLLVSKRVRKTCWYAVCVVKLFKSQVQSCLEHVGDVSGRSTEQ